MSKSFSMMNLLIKGPALFVRAAIKTLSENSYEIKTSTDSYENVSDESVVQIGLVFNDWDKIFVSPEQISFSSISEIKFIGLGNGGNGSIADGSYVFFKDYGENVISECYKFSNVNPHMEEFEAQCEIIELVRNSFMDHIWEYEYEDYSTGEYCVYAFNRLKDKLVIEKWNDDKNYNPTP